MFCGNCGTQIPEGGTCPKCNPVVLDVPHTQNKGVALRKGKYLSKEASAAVKSFSIIGFITTFLCLAIFVASYFSFVSRDIFKIPVLDFIDQYADTDMLMQEFDKYSDDIDKTIDELDCSKEDKERLTELKNEIENLDNGMSIKQLNSMIDTVKDVVDEDMIAEMEKLDPQIDIDTKQIETFEKATSVIYIIFICIIVFVAAFTLFGGFFRKNALVIVGLILSAILFFFFFDVLFLIVAIALHILLLVANGIVNSSYQKYKRSFR